jgi:hypothetical protein
MADFNRVRAGSLYRYNPVAIDRVPITPDVLVRNEGTVFLFCPLTSQGKEWIDEHVQPEPMWFGSALVVEHRFAWGLAQGMKDAGLVLA